MLNIYDSDKAPLSALRSEFDGQLGGDSCQLIYLRNTGVTEYYTDIVISYVPGEDTDDGVWSDTGWSIKYLYGTRRPTEAEWDAVASAASVEIPDIGDTSAADDSTYHPIWIRVYCPGNLDAQRRTGHSLQISYQDHLVGA